MLLQNQKTNTMKILKAKIQTKSNFRNLNGEVLNVYEIVKNRVTCNMFDPTIGKCIKADFTLNEVELIY